MELQNNLFELHPMWHLIKTVQSAPRSQEHVSVGLLCSFLENYINGPDRQAKESLDRSALHKGTGIRPLWLWELGHWLGWQVGLPVCVYMMRLLACLFEDDELDDLDQAVVLIGSTTGMSLFLWFPRRSVEKVTM